MCDNDQTDAEYARREMAYEMGGDTSDDKAFSAYCDKIATLLGVENMDGDQFEDGYSLDWTSDYFDAGLPAEEAAQNFRVFMEEVG